MTIKWKEIKVEPFTPPNFKTHLSYISSLNQISKNLRITHNLKIRSKIKKSAEIDKKINLIRLIKKSLDEEYKICSSNKDFSEMCCIWMPIKAYYLMFNLWIVLCHLIDGFALNSSHRYILKKLKELISNQKIVFNKEIFNALYSHKKILEFKTKRGEILRNDVDQDKLIQSLLKKIINYEVEDFKRRKKIKNFRKKVDRKKRDNFLKEKINICEFFYWYRIKANYRDLEFLNQQIPAERFFDFYKNYFELTNNFYNAFKNLVNDIAKIRFGEALIK